MARKNKQVKVTEVPDENIFDKNTRLTEAAVLAKASAEPVTGEPVTDEPVTDEPVTDEPVTDDVIEYNGDIAITFNVTHEVQGIAGFVFNKGLTYLVNQSTCDHFISRKKAVRVD